jgi:hypothetical protein
MTHVERAAGPAPVAPTGPGETPTSQLRKYGRKYCFIPNPDFIMRTATCKHSSEGGEHQGKGRLTPVTTGVTAA